MGGSDTMTSYNDWCSKVDRTDYSNDTTNAVAKGNLTESVGWSGGIGNSNYGYVGGGQSPSYKSTVNRIDYSNDTATALAKGNLSVAVRGQASTGSQSYGYFCGSHLFLQQYNVLITPMILPRHHLRVHWHAALDIVREQVQHTTHFHLHNML